MSEYPRWLSAPGGWLTALVVFVVTALATEATPLFLGTGAQARADWALLYGTMKFVVLPAASLLILVFLGVRVWRNRTLSIWPAITGVAAVLYLANLIMWPVFWFV